jgi:hypothetical protein
MCCYQVVTGQHHLLAGGDEEIMKQVVDESEPAIKLPKSFLQVHKTETTNLLQKMLLKDPENRLTIAKAMKSKPGQGASAFFGGLIWLHRCRGSCGGGRRFRAN